MNECGLQTKLFELTEQTRYSLMIWRKFLLVLLPNVNC